jgi:hypothetical protein
MVGDFVGEAGCGKASAGLDIVDMAVVVVQTSDERARRQGVSVGGRKNQPKKKTLDLVMIGWKAGSCRA